MNEYTERGFANREEYLKSLADDYGVSFEDVILPLAHLLGANEDFDGLITAIEDLEAVDY